MLLTADERRARVALVPDGALLLAEDAIAIRVDVGPGAVLELVEPAGTVAYDMRGGSATWSVDVRLGQGAALIWAGEPFVVAAGARVRRTTSVQIADGAVLVLRETLVLGRSGEPAGQVQQRTTAVDEHGEPVLVEELALDADRAPTLLGGRRVVDTVLVLGARSRSSPTRSAATGSTSSAAAPCCVDWPTRPIKASPASIGRPPSTRSLDDAGFRWWWRSVPGCRTPARWQPPGRRSGPAGSRPAASGRGDRRRTGRTASPRLPRRRSRR